AEAEVDAAAAPHRDALAAAAERQLPAALRDLAAAERDLGLDPERAVARELLGAREQLLDPRQHEQVLDAPEVLAARAPRLLHGPTARGDRAAEPVAQRAPRPRVDAAHRVERRLHDGLDLE